jgi:hypothetical protein
MRRLKPRVLKVMIEVWISDPEPTSLYYIFRSSSAGHREGIGMGLGWGRRTMSIYHMETWRSSCLYNVSVSILRQITKAPKPQFSHQ